MGGWLLLVSCRAIPSADFDGDGVPDEIDNCPFVENLGQADADADGAGDACSCESEALACTDGMAGEFPCNQVDFLGRVPNATFGSLSNSDVWGWTDPATGREIALLALDLGTAFIDLSNPECPLPLGLLPANGRGSPWRDIETLGSVAYIGSEADNHGVQLFDLTRLPTRVGPVLPQLEPDAVLTEVGASHTLSIATEAAVMAINGGAICEGMQLVDLSAPLSPRFGACYLDVGYVHDAQCVVYSGPDVEHQGAVMCFAGTGRGREIVIVDVSDVDAPVTVSRFDYGAAAEAQGGAGSVFAHQGWLTADHSVFLFGDELDELELGANTTTYLVDVSDLDAPALIDLHVTNGPTVDHQLYLANGWVYQANYTAGLRILDPSEAADGVLSEVAFFDVFPAHDNRTFLGSWSVYPWFESGVVPVSNILFGLDVLRPQLPEHPDGG